MTHRTFSSHHHVLVGFALLLPLGCDSDVQPDIIPPVESIDPGEAPIPVECIDVGQLPAGMPSVDGILEAVSQLQQVTDGITTQAQTALADMGAQAGAVVSTAEGLTATANSLAEQITGQIDGQILNGLGLVHQGAACVVDTNQLDGLTSACGDDLGGAESACEGACVGSGTGELVCDATLLCEGQAPDLSCAGECTGMCAEVVVANECPGTCTGVCDGACGSGLPGLGLDCAGLCDGECTGTCETDLPIAGACDGVCAGSCVWEAIDGSCGADAVSSCEPEAGSSVACEGVCEGVVDMQGTSDECDASADAMANALVECIAPAIDVDPSFAPISAQQQQHLLALAEGMVPSFGELLASSGQAEHLLASAFGSGGLLDAVTGLIEGLEALIAGAPAGEDVADLQCALAQLEQAQDVLEQIESGLNMATAASAIMQGSFSAESP